MDCFICQTPLTLKCISKHLKLIHSLKEKDTYRCTFGGKCTQYLSSFSSLIRHFKGHLQLQLTTGNNNVDISAQALYAAGTSNNSQVTHDQSLLSSLQSSVSNSATSNQASAMIESSNELLPLLPISQHPCFNIGEAGVAFALQLHNNNNFNRKDVVNIQKNVMENLMQPIIAQVRSFIQNNFPLTIEQTFLLSSVMQEIEDPFRNCATDHQMREHLLRNDYLSHFEEFTINNEIGQVYHRGEMRYDEVETTGVLLPISFQFRKIFEQNDQLLKTLKDMDTISKNIELNSHFIQGSLWHEKKKSFVDSNKIVIPFFLYIDDAEVNNPLGSHCDPVSFVYYSFPVINNCEIYAAAIMKGRDYKEFGNEKCLASLVREIIKMERDGIAIATSEGTKTVHFVLGLILGDNLGLNTVLGFTSSFSAHFFCRFCKMIKATTHTASSTIPNLLRNVVNYDADVSADNISSTGIKENSILNSIDSFHVTSNYAVDVMHDIFEGVCHYDMCHIIRKLIAKRYFDLNKLNDRKKSFNFGEIEIGNISPEITQANLDNSRLKMTAREMMNFVNLFSMMIGDYVPDDDEVWIFFLNLLDIIEILLISDISSDLGEHLSYLIKRHHTDYIHLFNDKLKPKHHLMLHYPSVILKSGPPRNYWCFRYEAKHKEFKSYARAMSSRRNICVSLAKKFQLKFAHLLLQPQVTKSFLVQKCHEISDTGYSSLIKNFCDHNAFKSPYLSYSECTYKSKTFKKGYFICQYTDINIQNAVIFQIVEILLFAGQDTPYVICKDVKIMKYWKHYAAYEIDISTEGSIFTIMHMSNFAGPPTNSHKTARGLHLVRPKQYC